MHLFVKGFKNQKLIFDGKRQFNWKNHNFDICLKPLILCNERYSTGWRRPLNTF